VRLLVVAALGPLSIQAVQAQTGVIDGVVTDSSLVPLAGVHVAINGSSLEVTTPESGRFRFNGVPAGLYVMTVGKLGYKSSLTTIRLAAGDTVRPAYELIPTGTVLGTVKVTGSSASLSRQEFDARRALGRGKFMAEDEIDKRNSARATELLRTFSTINVVAPLGSRSASAPVYYAMSRREGGSFNSCPMAVVVDGFQMPLPYDLEELPAPKEIMGIEVYSGNATIPVQFARWNSGCGLIMVWTKDGSSPRPPS
jgi:carboxypeptidase family protein